MIDVLLIPPRSVLGSNPYYYEHWCAHYELQYLDDADCAKAFPTSFDREWSCPVRFGSDDEGEGYAEDAASVADIVFDRTALDGLEAVQDANVQVSQSS